MQNNGIHAKDLENSNLAEKLKREIDYLSELSALAMKWDDTQIYDAMLIYQSQLYIEDDIRFLINNHAWLRARTVLDIGCGTGDFLRAMSNFFPEKTFTGVELVKAHADIAANRLKSRGIEILNVNAMDVQTKGVDFITAKLVIQHVREQKQFMAHLSSLLREGGSILIIDAADDKHLFSPPVFEIEKIYSALASHQRSASGERSGSQKIKDYAEELGLLLVHDEISTTPILREDDRRMLTKIFLLVGELGIRHFGFKIARGDLVRGLAQWMTHPYPYGQLGLHRILLKKNERE